MFSLLLAGTTAMQTISVSSKFYSYAASFCGENNVHNADIGNGNLVNQFKGYDVKLLGAEEWQARRRGAEAAKKTKEELMVLGFKPGNDGMKNSTGGDGKNLGDCNEQWGNTCQNSGGLYHWCNYSQYKCMSKYSGQNGAVTYFNMNKSPGVPETYNLYYDNDYPNSTSSTITKTMSTSSAQTISTTLSFHVGDSMTISAGIPGIMHVDDTFSWSFDMSKTNSDTKTTKDSFTWTGTIPEDAMSTTMVQFTVTKVKYSGAWKADISLPYYAKMWCGNKVKGHHEWFIPAGMFMGEGPYEGQGVFTGGAGVSMHTTVRKCKLFHDTVATCDESHELEAPIKLQ